MFNYIFNYISIHIQRDLSQSERVAAALSILPHPQVSLWVFRIPASSPDGQGPPRRSQLLAFLSCCGQLFSPPRSIKRLIFYNCRKLRENQTQPKWKNNEMKTNEKAKQGPLCLSSTQSLSQGSWGSCLGHLRFSFCAQVGPSLRILSIIL